MQFLYDVNANKLFISRYVVATNLVSEEVGSLAQTLVLKHADYVARLKFLGYLAEVALIRIKNAHDACSGYLDTLVVVMLVGYTTLLYCVNLLRVIVLDDNTLEALVLLSFCNATAVNGTRESLVSILELCNCIVDIALCNHKSIDKVVYQQFGKAIALLPCHKDVFLLNGSGELLRKNVLVVATHSSNKLTTKTYVAPILVELFHSNIATLNLVVGRSSKLNKVGFLLFQVTKQCLYNAT